MEKRQERGNHDPRSAVRRILERVVKTHEFGRISRNRVNIGWKDGREAIMGIGSSRNEAFVLDESNEWVYAQLFMWITGDPAMRCIDPSNVKNYIPADLRKGIYLCGPTGSGKTWAVQIMSALAMAVGSSYTFGGKTVYIHPTDVRADEVCAYYRRTGDLYRYVEDPVLCVQDVGSEPLETLYMGNRVNVIKALLESRGDRDDCVTVITSNLPMTCQAMRDRYGDRALSRLEEMCNMLVLTGKDRRRHAIGM